jgi:phosphatidylinositol phospholipase C delta
MDASQSIRSVGVTSPSTPGTTTASDTCTGRTRTVSGNTFNPAWQDSVRLSFDAYRGLLDIAFLSVEVKHAVALSDDVTVAHFCASLGTLEQGE